MATPKLGLAILTEAQEDKELTVNANSYTLDALINGVLEQRATPPSSPAAGDAYIVSATATGAWAGQTNKVAYWFNGGWSFITPAAGLSLFVMNSTAIAYFNGSSWVFLHAAVNGGVLSLPASAGSLANNAVYRVRNSGRSLTLSTATDGFSFTTIPDDNKYTWTATASGTAFRDNLSYPITSPATIVGSAVFTYDSTANQWLIFEFKNVFIGNGIFGYGYTNANVSITNLVSNTGGVATDTTGVGTARSSLAACGYGGDKGIFGYGYTNANVSITNRVSNTGAVATDTTGVGTIRHQLAACGYGGDKGIFGYGITSGNVSMTNLVSNTGVVASDTTGVGTARGYLAACGYGGDKGIFGYGASNEGVSIVPTITNLVSNTGVVATNTTGVGTARWGLAACGYGGDKGIFGYGYTIANVSMTNLVSNTGVVATDTTGVGSARRALAACGYGGDKGIFGYGSTTESLSMTNLVSNTGVVATDTTGVGTARRNLAACSFGL